MKKNEELKGEKETTGNTFYALQARPWPENATDAEKAAFKSEIQAAYKLHRTACAAYDEAVRNTPEKIAARAAIAAEAEEARLRQLRALESESLSNKQVASTPESRRAIREAGANDLD